MGTDLESTNEGKKGAGRQKHFKSMQNIVRKKSYYAQVITLRLQSQAKQLSMREELHLEIMKQSWQANTTAFILL